MVGEMGTDTIIDRISTLACDRAICPGILVSLFDR